MSRWRNIEATVLQCPPNHEGNDRNMLKEMQELSQARGDQGMGNRRGWSILDEILEQVKDICDKLLRAEAGLQIINDGEVSYLQR